MSPIEHCIVAVLGVVVGVFILFAGRIDANIDGRKP